MSVKFTLVAPTDLSAGTLRLTKTGTRSKKVLITPSRRELLATDIEPGLYTALIEPLGLRPRAFAFNIGESEMESRVELPPLSYLALGAQPVTEELRVALSEDDSVPHAEIDVAALEVRRPATAEKLLTVGLSEDRHPTRTGGWRPYRAAADVKVEFVDGRLELLVPGERPIPPANAGGRVRVSVLLENSRQQRAMVPLFAGGTRVVLQASPLSELDLDMAIVPADPTVRALTQALRAAVEQQVVAIIAGYSSAAAKAETRFVDPWTDIILALLSARFSAVVSAEQYGLPETTYDQFGWISDVHIIRARDALVKTSNDGSVTATAAAAALEHFRDAKRAGEPYFAYSNQLAMELLSALSDMKFPNETRNDLHWLYRRWAADNVSQRKAGTSYAWVLDPPRSAAGLELSAAQLAGDEQIAETPLADGEIQAARPTLDSRYASTVFAGRLLGGQITPASPAPARARVSSAREQPPVVRAIREHPDPGVAERPRKFKPARPARRASARPKASTAASDPPALKLRRRYRNDPQRGRFGGRDCVGGFRLAAGFDWVEGDDWVKITLEVIAVAGQDPSYDRPVEFFLHDTFKPDRIRADFRGDRASITVRAWGGFTVGAWLPNERIELELNLARLPSAPYPIKHY